MIFFILKDFIDYYISPLYTLKNTLELIFDQGM